jgi:cytochrome c biogenesis protein
MAFAAGARRWRSQTASPPGRCRLPVKLVDKDNGTLVAAKKGAGQQVRLHLRALGHRDHLLGGLLDSDVPIRFQQWFLGKTPFMPAAA